MAGLQSETDLHTSLPTRPHRWLVAGQRHTYTLPCLQDRTDGWSPVRDTHTHVPAYKTTQMAGRRSETHIHTSLPTRPHRWLVAGQRHTYTHTHVPPYKTTQMAGRRSDTHTHVPAYKTAHMAGHRSETHIHTSLPTRPHRWLVAGQRHTYTHTHTSLPTRPHRWLVAGQRHTHTSLPTRPHRGWSPVRGTHTHVPAYKTAQMAGRRSETQV